MDSCCVVFMACGLTIPYLWLDTSTRVEAPKDEFRKGKAKRRRVPEFPHDFHCGFHEPGSQHIAGMLEPESLRGISHFHSCCTVHTFVGGVIRPDEETITFL